MYGVIEVVFIQCVYGVVVEQEFQGVESECCSVVGEYDLMKEICICCEGQFLNFCEVVEQVEVDLGGCCYDYCYQIECLLGLCLQDLRQCY